MENEQLTIPKETFANLMTSMAKEMATAVKSQMAEPRLPVYYKFPEDIIAMTGGHIAEATIRSWKSAGYLRTFKIGAKAYVRPADWDWFLSHHKGLMAKESRNRGARLGT